LQGLAAIKKLPELLTDENRRREFGIPLKELEKVLTNPENHGGEKGYGLVKSLMYKEKHPHGAQIRPQRLPDPAPVSATSSAPAARHQINPNGARAASQQESYDTKMSQSRISVNGDANLRAQPTSAPHGYAYAASPTDAAAAAQETSSSSRLSIRDALNQQHIFLPSYAPGTYRMHCPKCKGGSNGEQSFSVTVEEQSKSAMWNCFRSTCGYAGSSHVDKPSVVNESGFFVSAASRKRKEEPPVIPIVNLEPLTDEMKQFFVARGISTETLSRNGVASAMVYDPGEKRDSRVIAFPYYRDGVLVNVKYRTMNKRFWQVRGAEKVLYGLDDIVGAPEVIIVEGEMDKLALEEAGFRNVVSVPDGAPARVRDGALPPAAEDTKYSYLWKCRAWLDQAVRVVIATDNDAPGDALAEELARRLGRERCWRVRWPLTQHDHEYAASEARVELQELLDSSESLHQAEKVSIEHKEMSTENMEEVRVGEGEVSTVTTASVDPRWYRKDANEVLIRDGSPLLRGFVEAAEPLPIRGLLRFHEYYDDIIKYYFLELRDAQAVSTGWRALDQYYKVIPGELTIVTGVPNSGKSEWIDSLLCNLSELHGWTFALCSMEKRATDHARQLAEKFVGRPFFDQLAYSRGMKRMSYEELDGALDWVDDRFHLIRYEDEQLPSIDWVLEIAKAAVYRYGIRGLVIDPYNELDHQRPASMSETEYVSQMLTKVKRFAQTAGVHVWFVAHPRQLREWRGQAPNLYDISGSAHFINKADNGIVVHRNRDPNAPSAAQVQVLVRKVRNKAAGTIGDVVLEYDRINGRYIDVDDPRPPRTAKQMAWLEKGQQGIGGAPSGGMWMHSDGTVNSDPPDYS